MKFKFAASVILEASSEEDALRKLGSRLGAIARHVGNGVALGANDPFFTLTTVEKGEAIDIAVDPIVAARQAEEAAAAAAQSEA